MTVTYDDVTPENEDGRIGWFRSEHGTYKIVRHHDDSFTERDTVWTRVFTPGPPYE